MGTTDLDALEPEPQVVLHCDALDQFALSAGVVVVVLLHFLGGWGWMLVDVIGIIYLWE